mmetsp:Transcript_13575/g.19910  ORF Transcript_13575/g.19910 Transcript_13575/m.19910 type:complete len:94 (+) Transcript_13575:394-675(+)
MSAWAEDQGTTGSMVTMMGDPHGELAEALDMKMTHPGPPGEKGLIGRSKRHALFVDDGVVKVVRVSEAPDDPAGDDDPSATMAGAMLEAIASA